MEEQPSYDLEKEIANKKQEEELQPIVITFAQIPHHIGNQNVWLYNETFNTASEAMEYINELRNGTVSNIRITLDLLATLASLEQETDND